MRGGGKLKYKRLCQAFLSASSRSAKKKQEKEKKSLILRLTGNLIETEQYQVLVDKNLVSE